MKKPELVDFSQERIRVLHWTWIAFFITFYVWFNMAPMATTMLKSVDWLTKEHIKVLAISNVALTIPARIVVGAMVDRYGPRKTFSGLMIAMSLPALAFALGTSFIQLLVARLVLGSIGAGFVIGIKMVANWFPPKMVGRAEGFYAGWGNFGSAWAAMTRSLDRHRTVQGLPRDGRQRLALRLGGQWSGFAGLRRHLLVPGPGQSRGSGHPQGDQDGPDACHQLGRPGAVPGLVVPPRRSHGNTGLAHLGREGRGEKA